MRPSVLGLSSTEAASCLVFLSPKPITGRLSALPRYSGLETTPAWRANLRIIAPTTSVSYQGEYPAGMFDIPRPRLVSVSALLQPGVANSLLLASFNGKFPPGTGSIKITRAKTGEPLLNVPVAWNRVNHIDLSSIVLADVPELILLSSEDIAGIPIFFAHDNLMQYLSLEHSHPPAELTVFGQADARNRVVQKMRSDLLALSGRG